MIGKVLIKKIRIDNNQTEGTTDGILKDLLALSKKWAEEKCCPAYYENAPEDFCNQDVYIAIDQGKIIAYAVGHIKELTEATSYNEVGEKAFELDELYVAPEYRNRGIGKELFRHIETEVKDKYCISVKTKKRDTNPLVQINGTAIRIYIASEKGKRIIEDIKNYKDSKYACLDINF